MDLKIANRGKEHLIDQLLFATGMVGQLQTKRHHLGAPKSAD